MSDHLLYEIERVALMRQEATPEQGGLTAGSSRIRQRPAPVRRVKARALT